MPTSADPSRAAPLPPAPLAAESSVRLRNAELVPMVAALMALNALALDIMLPALDLIAHDLGVAGGNQRQGIVLAYVLGFGTPQLVFGPLTDRYGRRPVLFVSLAGYAATGAACTLAGSFTLLLAIRFVQGVFAAGARVVAVAIVRDAYRGRGMARFMSLVMTVFMVVPVLAPALGQLVLWVAPWQWCFGVLAIAGAAMLAWTWLRLPETLAPADRRPFDVPSMVAAYREALGHRVTRGYTLAAGFAFGALFAYLSASEQVFREVFDEGDRFALWFAAIAATMSATNFANARLVERFGMRRLSHGALLGFVGLSASLLGLMELVGPRVTVFVPLFSIVFALFGLIGANFNALAMEPLGRLAGTGSAAYGFSTTTVAGAVGGFVAARYDGTVAPLLEGFVGIGVLALVVVLVTERGRLFGVE